MTTENQTDKKLEKTSKIWNWVAIIVGALICAAGAFSFFDNDAMNDTLTEAGAGQIAAGIVSEYPQSAPVINCIADVLDAAVEARVGDPKAIATMIQEEAAKIGIAIDTKPIIAAIINQINTAYEKCETEEQFLHKLELIARGLRSGV